MLKNNLTKIILTIALITGYSLASLFTAPPVSAAFEGCGTYFPAQPAAERCIDASTNQAIPQHTVCTSNPQVCCPTSSLPAECAVVPEPEPEPEDPDDISDENCGAWVTVAGSRSCRDTSGKVVPGAVSCALATECCRQADQCRVRWSWNDEIGGCEEDPNGIYESEERCETQSVQSQRPDPDQLVPYQLCGQIPRDETEQKGDCCECATGSRALTTDTFFSNRIVCATRPTATTRAGIWTAVGCIRATPQNIVAEFIQIGLGIAGGVALLMILSASFLFTTSKGDPKRTNEARDLMTSAVIGLLFIIFSVTILQFIGIQLLRIPDFGI